MENGEEKNFVTEETTLMNECQRFCCRMIQQIDMITKGGPGAVVRP